MGGLNRLLKIETPDQIFDCYNETNIVTRTELKNRKAMREKEEVAQTPKRRSYPFYMRPPVPTRTVFCVFPAIPQV